MNLRRLPQFVAGVALASVLCLAGCSLFGHKEKPVGPGQGRYHTIHEPDTLAKLEKEYGVPAEAIARANNLSNPALLYEGLVLWIPPRDEAGAPIAPNPTPGSSAVGQPGGVWSPDSLGKSDIPRPPDETEIGPPPVDTGKTAPRPMKTYGAKKAAQTDDSVARDSARVPEAGALGFHWPIASGRFKITRRFSAATGGPNRGLDLQAKRGTPVLASRDGVVISAGSDLRGFGNMIVLDHEDGYTTIYAHNDKNLVAKGQRVRRGQTIARVGSTDTNSPKLHFEIRKGTSAIPVDPLGYLPESNR